MSNAWEVTTDDIEQVLDAHGIKDCSIDEIFEEMVGSDFDRVEKAVLYYTDFDDQVNSALDEIEDILIENGRIPAGTQKKFSISK